MQEMAPNVLKFEEQGRREIDLMEMLAQLGNASAAGVDFL